MATDTGEQQALQAAMQQINTLHSTLTQDVTSFDQLFADHGQEATPEAQGQGAAELAITIAQLHDFATQLTDEIGQKFHQTVETLHTDTQQIAQQTQTHAQDWDQAHEALKAATTTLDQTLTQAAEEGTATLASLHNGVQQAEQSTTDILHQLDTSVQTVHTTITDTVKGVLSKASDTFHEGVDSTLKSKAVQHLTETYQNAGQALDNVKATAEHISQHFGQEAQGALDSFAHGVVTGLKDELVHTGETLAKDAMEALAAIIATCVAETTAGSAVTAAMSPILPEVIIVKEASEVIKDLITVFKALSFGAL